METYKTLTRKVNVGDECLKAKVTVKYYPCNWFSLEECFKDNPEKITEAYARLAKGETKFVTILVEAEFADICGSDCVGSVFIDSSYSIEDCVKENRMVFKATSDLLKKMADTYKKMKTALV